MVPPEEPAQRQYDDGADIDVRAHRVRCHAGAEEEKGGQDHKPAGKEQCQVASHA